MTNKQIIAILPVLAVLLVVAIAFGALRTEKEQEALDSGNLACDADGFVCPDGSVVGRVPPACQFAPCPGVFPDPGGLEGQSVGILEGTITLSPTCPVERTPPDPRCAPRPYPANVSARSQTTGSVVATTKATQQGAYTLDLPAGTYTITIENNGPLPYCPEMSASIAAGGRTLLDISCDTGIR